MGRHNGSWSPVYGQVWDHAKTLQAAHFLAEHDRKIPQDLARFAVVGFLNRVCLWCLANGETGSISGLDDVRLATIAWPEALAARPAAKAGRLVRQALSAGGFLEGDPGFERVHDFADHHSRILRERNRKRRDRDAEDSAEGGADTSADQSADTSAERSADRSAEASASTDNDTDTDNDNDTDSPPRGPPRGPTRPRPKPGPQDALARDLATRLGSSLRPCQAQVRALRAEGWDLDRIRAAVERHATAGVAPWDWTKLAKGTTSPPRHGGLTGEQIRRMTEAPPGPDLLGLAAGDAP